MKIRPKISSYLYFTFGIATFLIALYWILQEFHMIILFYVLVLGYALYNFFANQYISIESGMLSIGRKNIQIFDIQDIRLTYNKKLTSGLSEKEFEKIEFELDIEGLDIITSNQQVHVDLRGYTRKQVLLFFEYLAMQNQELRYFDNRINRVYEETKYNIFIQLFILFLIFGSMIYYLFLR